MANAPIDLGDVQKDLRRAIKLIAKMAPDYEKRREFYDGTRREVWSSKEVAKMLSSASTAHPIALAHIPVDALMDKVNLTNLKVTGNDTAGLVLDQDWEDNNLEDEVDDWNRHAGYLGDYYAIIDPDSENDDGEAVTTSIVGSSPMTTVMVYSSKDSRTPLYGAKVWCVNDDDDADREWYATMFYDDSTLSLVTNKGADSSADATQFGPDLDDDADDDLADDSWVQAHEGGKPLLIHFRVDGQPYGRPLHRKAFGPQDAITKISATNLSTVDAQGFPTRYALLDPMAELDDDIDDDFGTDGPGINVSPDGMTTGTSGRSKTRLRPGTINILRGVKEVGQFAAAETDTFLKNLDWYTRVMAVATGTPLFEFDLDGEQPSGEARRRAEGRINKHAGKVIRSLGSGYRKLGDTLLALRGIADAVVVATFQPVESSTDKDGLELVALKILNGVPLRVALMEAGYTDEQVEEWWPKASNDEDDVTALSMSMLDTLSKALSELGKAKNLGSINDAQLAALLPGILIASRGNEPAPAPVDPTPAPVEKPEVDPEQAEVDILAARANLFAVLTKGGYTEAAAASIAGLPDDDDQFEEVAAPVVPDTLIPIQAPAPGAPVPTVPPVIDPTKPTIDPVTSKPVKGATPPALAPFASKTAKAAKPAK